MSLWNLSFIQGALASQKMRTTQTLPDSFVDIFIDTRHPSPQGLFIALKGEFQDGHQFVLAAQEQGASAAIVAESSVQSLPATLELPLIIVSDTTKALQLLATAHLARMPAKRVALTGSNGKTTTKEMIRAVMMACTNKDAVFANEGNFNNHFGLPLSALLVREHHQIAIFEMGMNHFGEIATLAQIVKPQVGLVTNMGSAHAGNLGGPEGVAKAKAELFEALSSQGTAIVNADDPRCVREAQKTKAKQITFGKAKWANLQVTEMVPAVETKQLQDLGLWVTFTFNSQSERVFLPTIGEHNATNAAGALACALALGFPFGTAAQGLTHFKSVKGRLQSYKLPGGALLIDDSYNANPESMEAGLKTLNLFPAKRHLAVLGDMRELGDHASSFHHSIGAACAQAAVTKLYACGDMAKYYGEGAIENGLSPDDFIWAQTSELLADKIATDIEPTDVIWVKGSNGMKMWNVVARLMRQ